MSIWKQSNINSGNYNTNSISGSNAISTTINGIWYSTDGGKNWFKSTGITTSNWVANISEIYAIASKFDQTSGIWYSIDGGQSWEPSTITTGYWNPRISGSNAVGSNLNTIDGIWYSNGGQNWFKSTGITTGYWLTNISGIYAIASNTDGTGGIWYSIDGGKNWFKSIGITTGFWTIRISGIYAVASNSDGNNGIWYSTDGGQNWFKSTDINIGYWQHISISGSNAIASKTNTTDVKLYSTKDGGQNWFKSTDITNEPISNTTDGIWYSTNGGKNWFQSTGITTGEWLTNISGSNAFASDFNETNGIWYSTDGGKNWFKSSGITTGFWNAKVSGSNAIATSIFNGTGGIWYSNLEAPCFLANTKILCLTHIEEYIPISKIKKGDLVKGVFSKKFVKVVHCGYNIISIDVLAKYNFPRRIPKDFFSKDLPQEDIYLSGGHRILFHNSNNDLIYRIPTSYISELNKHEIKSESEIKRITNQEECRYYHIELEDTTEGVIASGLEVESLEKGDWDKFNFIENII